jgi:hypothetical protein
MFDATVRLALKGVENTDEKSLWRLVFNEDRRLWERAYKRAVDWPYRLDLTLLERPEGEPEPERHVLIA